jgi:hypothetical protein
MTRLRESTATLILLLCGIAVDPFFAGIITSQTPKASIFIGVADRSHLSARWFCQSYQGTCTGNREQRTEISDEVCINGIRSPFAVRYIAILIDIETEFLEALGHNELDRHFH